MIIRPALSHEKGISFRNHTVYMIEKAGQIVGHIEKAKNTRTSIHPWKVFRREASGPHTMVATFFDDKDSVKIGPSFDYENCKIGGKAAAFNFARRVF